MVKLPTSEQLKLDKRTMERLVGSGKLSAKEVDQARKALEDCAGSAEKVTIWDEGHELPSKKLRNMPPSSRGNGQDPVMPIDTDEESTPE